jgi:hypothetical protein
MIPISFKPSLLLALTGGTGKNCEIIRDSGFHVFTNNPFPYKSDGSPNP